MAQKLDLTKGRRRNVKEVENDVKEVSQDFLNTHRPHKININISTDDLIKLKAYCTVNKTNQQDSAFLAFKSWIDTI